MYGKSTLGEGSMALVAEHNLNDQPLTCQLGGHFIDLYIIQDNGLFHYHHISHTPSVTKYKQKLVNISECIWSKF
jgi:hypothetical protein